jgi:hypothetical protein
MFRFSRILAISMALSALPAHAQEMSAPEAYEAVRSGKITLIDIRTPPE